MFKKFLSSPRTLIVLFALMKFSIQMMINVSSGLHRDEYLYLSFHEHPDWGYFSVPPMIGVFSYLIYWLSDAPAFMVRLFPALAGAATVFVSGMMVMEAGGKRFAVILASSAYIMSSVFIRVNGLFQPVSFDVLFWLLSAFFILRMMNRNDPKFWILIFSVWGLAFLNKYMIVFLMTAVVISLLLTAHRKLLFTKYFYFGCGLFFIIVFPNLFWQYQHQFPVIQHMTDLQRYQLVHVSAMAFLTDQVMINLHVFALLIFGLIVMLFVNKEKTIRLFGIMYLVSLAIMLLLKGKNYYLLGMYPPLVALSACLAERYLNGAWRFLKYAFLIFALTQHVPVIPAIGMPLMDYPGIEKYSRGLADIIGPVGLVWEDGREHLIAQDFADMTGWDELSGIVIATYKNLDIPSQNTCAIYAENYGLAGSIRYYGKPLGLPEPISFSDQFRLWAPDSLNRRVFIYVNDDTSDIAKYFSRVTKTGEVNNQYFRENGMPVYLCEEPRDSFYVFYSETARRLKDRFRR